ncbi:MAG: hypothetical protein J7L44_01570 [Candidatus Diapherotrites archaeon]|nr:hypothetical protein [Candidatus Diapherotrites archaeon]
MDLFVRFVPGEFKNLEIFKRFVLNWSRQVKKKKPLLVVFDEAVLGSRLVTRKETKRIVEEISRGLPDDVYVFFAIAEQHGRAKRDFSITGYIVEPACAGKAKYRVYPKLMYATDSKGRPKFMESERNIAKRIAKTPEEMEKVLLRWIKRGALWERRAIKTKRSIFPEISIAGKKVRIAICADLSRMIGLYGADIIVVPSKLLHINEQVLKEITEILRPGQHILISSALRRKEGKKYISPLKIFRSKERGRRGIVPLRRKRIYRI